MSRLFLRTMAVRPGPAFWLKILSMREKIFKWALKIPHPTPELPGLNMDQILADSSLINKQIQTELKILRLVSATAGLTCNDQDRRKWTVRRQRRKCFVDCGGCFSKWWTFMNVLLGSGHRHIKDRHLHSDGRCRYVLCIRYPKVIINGTKHNKKG